MKGLTKRQREVLDFIQNYIEIHHFSPSYREIMKHFGFSSAGSVHKHISALKRKNAISNEKNCSRSVTPVDAPPHEKSSGAVNLPFIGRISSGMPIETFSQITTLAVPAILVPSSEQCYIFQISGDSLANDFIADGDLIIVEAKNNPEPGELVIALINNNETTIKRYFPEGLYIRLEAPHSNAMPITVRSDEIYVQGSVIGLMRMYK